MLDSSQASEFPYTSAKNLLIGGFFFYADKHKTRKIFHETALWKQGSLYCSQSSITRNTEGRWSKSCKTLVLQRWTSQYVSGLSWIEQYTEPCFLAIPDLIIFIKNENSLRKISADCFLYNPFLLNNLYENKFIYHKNHAPAHILCLFRMELRFALQISA